MAPASQWHPRTTPTNRRAPAALRFGAHGSPLDSTRRRCHRASVPSPFRTAFRIASSDPTGTSFTPILLQRGVTDCYTRFQSKLHNARQPPRYVPAADCSSHSRSVTLSLRSTPSFVPLFGDSLRSATQLVPALPDCSGIDAIPVRIDSDAHSFSDAACPPPHYGDLSAQDPNTHAQCGIMPNTALYS